MEEFSAAIATPTKPEKRNGKIYQIILFGSYGAHLLSFEPIVG